MIDEDPYEVGAELVANPDPAKPHVDYRPVPEDERHANALLRERRRLLADIAETKTFYDEQREELDAWREDRCSGPAAQVANIDSVLTSYHVARLEDDEKATTIKLPAGKLTTRKGRKAWEVADRERLTAVLRGTDAVEVTEKVLVSKIDGEKVVDPETGEVLASKQRGDRSFDIVQGD